MPESEALGRAVDSRMKNLRQKLTDAGTPNLIEDRADGGLPPRRMKGVRH